MEQHMQQVSANGLLLPVLGQGSWELGEDAAVEDTQAQALRRRLALGMTLIDTAEMYGDGRSEAFIGRALKGVPRESYQLCTKVFPHHAGEQDIFRCCDASLSRLQTEYIDLYLLHWRGSVPLEETVACMERLAAQGKILRWGVSNFDVADMEDLMRVQGGERCAVDQVLYNLGSRGVEYDLLPWLNAHQMAMMAYCPLAQGGTLTRMHKHFSRDFILAQMAAKYECTVMQLMLAFVLKQPHVIAIPKAARQSHVESNAAALSLSISKEDWAAIDKAFPPPTTKMHLDIE
ncbi:MAG: aldo/keto reductase [Eubacteriales bacterium]|nr:aldo/keto reductase [Eubacteriales bacterium]